MICQSDFTSEPIDLEGLMLLSELFLESISESQYLQGKARLTFVAYQGRRQVKGCHWSVRERHADFLGAIQRGNLSLYCFVSLLRAFM